MNKEAITKLLIFTAGAAVGSLVTWKALKTKYEQIAQEDANSVREMYQNKYDNESEDMEDISDEPEEYEEDEDSPETVRDYAARLSSLNYTDYTNFEESKEVPSTIKPYVIPPDEFGEDDEYETNTLMYYADGVLTDDMDNPIEDVERLIGVDVLDHFGEYEDDSVFVKNVRLKSYFEILRDESTYSEIVGDSPHSNEGE